MAKKVRMTKDREEKRDGVIGEIWNKFFKPMFFGDHHDNEYEAKFFTDVLDHVFSQRHIYIARCKKDLKALGGFSESNTVPDFGSFDNTIHKNSRVWIRDDERSPYVEVETEDGRVFKMSNKQYREIKKYFTQEQ